MIVRSVTPDDASAWLRMRRAFWPDGSEAEHAGEIAAFLEGRAREPLAVLIAEDGSRKPVGFAELSIRPSDSRLRNLLVARGMTNGPPQQ